MDRKAWIDERRRATEEIFDREASTYDAEDVPITPTHRRFVARLLERSSSGARILDAPCGTGKYFSTILDAGCFVVGTDQSSGMLEVARAKHPDFPTEKVGLQELTFASQSMRRSAWTRWRTCSPRTGRRCSRTCAERCDRVDTCT